MRTLDRLPPIRAGEHQHRAGDRRRRQLLTHRFDHAPPWPRTVAVTTLLHEPLDIALPAGHRLAAKKRLTPRDVTAEPWVTVHPGFPVLPLVEAVATAAGRRPEIVHRVNEFTVVAELVAAGSGIALLPRWTTLRHPGVVLRPLVGVRARRHIDVLHRPEATARRAVRTVLAELRRAAAEVQRQPQTMENGSGVGGTD